LAAQFFYLFFSAFRLVPIGIFAGVPFMGIQGFIPGPDLIVHALTPPREKIPQLRMEIHSTALYGEFFYQSGSRSKSGIHELHDPVPGQGDLQFRHADSCGTLLRPSRIKTPEIPVGFRFRH